MAGSRMERRTERGKRRRVEKGWRGTERRTEGIQLTRKYHRNKEKRKCIGLAAHR